MKRRDWIVWVAVGFIVAVGGRSGFAGEPLVIEHHDPLLRLLMAHPQQRFATAAEIIADRDGMPTEEIRQRTAGGPMKHLFRASKSGQAALDFVLLKRDGGAVPPRVRDSAAPVNVVVVAIDGLPRAPLAGYGGKGGVSPNLDRLARAGAVFAEAQAPTGFSQPSYASLLTGVTPDVHGLVVGAERGTHRISRQRATLASLLGAAGLDTVGFVTHPSLGGAWGFDTGFDLYQMRSYVGAVEMVAHALLWLDWHAFHAVRGLELQSFFLFLQLADLRSPAATPQPYQAMYPADSDAAALRFVDDQIGVLVDTLARRGVLDDSVIAVVGVPTGTGDEATPVPLVVRAPRFLAAGGRIDGATPVTELLAGLVAWTGGASSFPRPAWARQEANDEGSLRADPLRR